MSMHSTVIHAGVGEDGRLSRCPLMARSFQNECRPEHVTSNGFIGRIQNRASREATAMFDGPTGHPYKLTLAFSLYGTMG